MKWLQIKNKAGDTESIDEIFIFGEIGDWFDELDQKTLTDRVRASEGDTISIRINSAGGNVFTALSLYSLLKSSGKKIKAHVDGICASAATFLACAADDVVMTVGGQFMIHDPLINVYGNATLLRKTADILDGVGGSIAMLYKEKTGQEIDDITAKMNAETWMNAHEALEYGFVSELLETGAMTASTKEVINMAGDRFKNIPIELLNNVKSVSNQSKGDGKPMDLANFKASHSAIAEQFKAEILAQGQASIDNAVNAERERIQNITEATPVGQEELAKEAIKNGLSAGEFAINALKAEKSKGADFIKARAEATKVIDNVDPSKVEDEKAKEKAEIDNFFQDFSELVAKGVK